LAEYRSTKDIVKDLYTIYGKNVTPRNINMYRNTPKWKDLIQKYRDEYLVSINHVPIANKRYRIDIRQSLLEKLMTKRLDSEQVSQYRLMSENLREAKDEVEVKDDSPHNVVYAQFNNLSDKEIEFKRKKVMEEINAMNKKIRKKEKDNAISLESTT